MADDNLEVTDQPLETPGEGTPSDALAEFDSEEEDTKAEGEPEEPKEEPKPEDLKKPEERAEEEPEEKPSEEEADKGSEETDEDEKRGEELLEAQKKAEEEEEARKKADKPTEEPPKAPEPYTAKDIALFDDAVPDSAFQVENVEINGQPLNLKEFMAEYPETKIISGIAAKHIVDRLLSNGYLVSGEVHKQALESLKTEFSNQRFIDKVTDKTHGVPKAPEIWKSDKFQEWRPKQSKAIQALFDSNDPEDHIRGFKRFMNDSGLKKAKEDKAEAKEKQAKEKEKVDGIYKTTARQKGRKPETQEDGGIQDAYDEFNKDDDE